MTASSTLPERLIAPDAAASLDAVLARHGLGKNLVLVCDDATWVALGERVFSHHLHRYTIRPHSLGRHAVARMELATQLMESAADADGLLAVGAGTVNDITKFVANALNKPYISLPTAASMNGYTSGTASLEKDGFKRSFTARTPKAVVADLDVLLAAPRRLSRAGLGDTLARTTVEADCLLSHYILGTPYPREAFEAMRLLETPLIIDAIKLTTADPDYMKLLFTALLEAGDWMAKTGSSAVASQGEHMIAHTAELRYGGELRQIFHGELIAVTTVVLAQLQRRILLNPISVRPLPVSPDKFRRLFGRINGPVLAGLYAKKMIDIEQAAEINYRLQSEWPAMKAAINRIMRSPITIERALLQANIPLNSKNLGLSEDRLASAMDIAHLTRDRFGFLDLALMIGKRAG